MASEEIIERKLLLDGDGAGENKRINTLVTQITKWLLHTEDIQDAETEYMRIMALLSTFKNNRKKYLLYLKTQKEELKKCKENSVKFTEKIKELKDKIKNESENLNKSKFLKQNRMKYSLLARVIKEQPSRVVTQEKLRSLKKDIGELETEKMELDNAWNKRIRQFMIISTSANYLQSVIYQEPISVPEDSAVQQMDV